MGFHNSNDIKNPNAAKKFCSNCGETIDVRAEICPHCGVRVKNSKSPTMAAFLSFLWTGLGQVYNGQVGKGIFLWFVCLIGLCCGVFIGVVVWVYAMWDAYTVANGNR